jgi:hypothetical protein
MWNLDREYVKEKYLNSNQTALNKSKSIHAHAKANGLLLSSQPNCKAAQHNNLRPTWPSPRCAPFLFGKSPRMRPGLPPTVGWPSGGGGEA